MQTTQPIFLLQKRLWHHVSSRRRRQFGLLLILMIISSFAEIISIGAVLPFLGVLTSPIYVFEHPLSQSLIQFLGLTAPEQLLLPLTILFGLAALMAGTMRLILLWSSTRLSFAAGADLSINIYRRTLYQPYAVHVARNSSEIINTISNKTKIVMTNILMLLNLIGAGVMLVAILFALLTVEPVIALVAFGGFGLIYVFIIWLTRKQQLRNSQHIAYESTQVIKCLQEGLGGIRDILIDSSQNIFCQIYQRSDTRLRKAQGSSTFISSSPRYGMEALGMVLIAILAYVLAQQTDGITKAIPILGALALGAQRLLPVLQQVYAAWSNIQSGQASLHDTLELLEQPLPNYVNEASSIELPFRKQIELGDISFRYSQNTPWVLRNINLTIAKGSRIGFIGATGSGKSTLLDIVMGLLHPTEGQLKIDGQPLNLDNHHAWQSHIAHVPQTIFLADSTIEENIAFGISKENIDHERVRLAAHKAQIGETIESWPTKYETIIGERGIRLSGGQRQRIGIARALYKRADVIIFDEATSALDNETEQDVMKSIENLSENLTILIIAHRLTTLKGCTQIVELNEGNINRIGNYKEITKNLVI